MLPKTDYALMTALDRAAAKAAGYAVPLKLTTDMVAERVADAAVFHYTLAVIGNLLTGSKDWTAFKKLLLKGPDSGAVLPFPAAIDFGTAPATVSAAIAARYSRFVAHCKLQPGCTENVAIDMGFVSPSHAAVDLDVIQPVIKLAKRPDGIFNDWTWDGLGGIVDTIEIHVDRGDTQGDRFLVIDSTPGYLDTAAFPAALAKWTYKAIWRIGENQVGLWSNPVSIAVGG